MKKIILIIICVISAHTFTIAQEHGDFIVGGNFHFSTVSKGSLNSGNQSELSIKPLFGYMLNDKISVGFTPGIHYAKYSYSDPYYYSSSTSFEFYYVTLNAILRSHYDLTDNLHFFLEPNLGVAFDPEDKSTPKSYQINASLGAGLLYSINQKFSLELYLASIDYLFLAGGPDAHAISINYAITSPTIGIKYYF